MLLLDINHCALLYCLLYFSAGLENFLVVFKMIQLSLRLIYCLWKVGCESRKYCPQKACGNLMNTNERFAGIYTGFICGTIHSYCSFRTFIESATKYQDFSMYEKCRISFESAVGKYHRQFWLIIIWPAIRHVLFKTDSQGFSWFWLNVFYQWTLPSLCRN